MVYAFKGTSCVKIKHNETKSPTSVEKRRKKYLKLRRKDIEIKPADDGGAVVLWKKEFLILYIYIYVLFSNNIIHVQVHVAIKQKDKWGKGLIQLRAEF